MQLQIVCVRRPEGSSAMKRFLRPRGGEVGPSGDGGGPSSSSRATEPGRAVGPSGDGGGPSSSSGAFESGGEPGPFGGGGGPSRSSGAAEPGDAAGEDLEVSSNSSGEVLEATVPPEGVDVNWAQLPQTWHLARWCVARAHSVCRRVGKVMAAVNVQKNKVVQGSAAKLHVKLQGGRRGCWVATAQAQEIAMEKAQRVLEALRSRAESMDGKAENTLSALAVCDVPRAQELYQLGLRVRDPTASQKTFRRVLADLGLVKAPKRPWRGRRQEAQAQRFEECKVVLRLWRRAAGAREGASADSVAQAAGASESSAAGGGEKASADSVAQAAGAPEPSAAGGGERSSAVGESPAGRWCF